MSNVKSVVRSILDQLPDDCSMEDVQYHLYVRNKIERGIQQADAGEVVSHEEVKAYLKKWTTS